MGFSSEIFLNKKHVTRDDWENFIKIISHYNGLFKKWEIIIRQERSQIRYFVKTSCSLPATINNMDSFMLKSSEIKEDFVYQKGRMFLSKFENSLIDIINYYAIKRNAEVKMLSISFMKVGDNKIKSKCYFYVESNNTIIKYRLVLFLPQNILSVDFEGNKRYLYKSVPKYLDISKILHLLNNDSQSSILKIDTFPYIQGNFYLNQNRIDFNKHSIIMGSSGCGKSKFLSLLIHNISKNKNLKDKYKVVVIDPHAALENDIGGLGETIDFSDINNSINLFMNSNKDVVISTELLLSLFNSLIGSNYNSKLERVLRHSIHILLTGNNFNFKSLRQLLLDIEYRNELIQKLKHELPVSVIDFFLMDFNDLKTKSYGEAISPIIAFVDEMEMIPVFNEEHIEKNLEMTINNNFLSIFSLDRTRLGDKVTKTIAGLVMQQLLTLVQSKKRDEHIIFVVDEVAVVENPILARFLSEARKYNLSLILAGQYFNQISETIKNAIFSNVINYYIFRVSKMDAINLVDNFNMKIPVDDSKEQKIKALSELNNRECIVRISSNDVLLPAFKASTLDYKSIPRVKKEDNKKTSDSSKDNNKPLNKKIFSVGSGVSLKDILINNSSSREVG